MLVRGPTRAFVIKRLHRLFSKLLQAERGNFGKNCVKLMHLLYRFYQEFANLTRILQELLSTNSFPNKILQNCMQKFAKMGIFYWGSINRSSTSPRVVNAHPSLFPPALLQGDEDPVVLQLQNCLGNVVFVGRT